MKTIKKNELFQNLGDFLKSKGIELNDGTYTTRIQQSCNLLTDAINATQKTVRQTRVQVDQALDQLRQSIHEHTAPRPPRGAATSARSAAGAKTKTPGADKSPARPSASRKGRSKKS